MDKTTKYEKMILDIISPLDGIKFSNEPGIQRNMTEIDPGKKLVYEGIPPSEIVVGFLKPKMRELSDYAVA